MMKTEKRPLLLMTYDLEAFYYGDTLVEQSDEIDRLRLLSLSEVYDFTRDELEVERVSIRDLTMVECNGQFPSRLSDLQDQYY